MNTFREKVRDFIDRVKSSKKLSLLTILLLVAAVPLTVFIAQQAQDVRQRASTGTTAITISKTNLTPGEQFTASWTNITIPPTSTPDPAQCTNLIKNNSFETPQVTNTYTANKWQLYGAAGISNVATTENIANWDPKGNNAGYQVELHNALLGNGASGPQYVEIDIPGVISLTQSVPTQQGEQYQISFFYSPRPDVTGTQKLGVYWNGQQVGTVDGTTHGTTLNWQEKKFTVTAAGTTSKIGFGALADSSSGSGNLIDTVSVMQTSGACATTTTPTNTPIPTPTNTPSPTPTSAPTPTPDPNKLTLTATVECTTQPDMYKSAGPTVTLRFNVLPVADMPSMPAIPGMPTMAPMPGIPLRYTLTRTPEFPYSDPPWKTPKTVDIGSIGKDGFITVYDGSYIGIENGKHYEYVVTANSFSGSTAIATSNSVSVDTPSSTACPIPATSPRNLQVIGSCNNGQAAYEIRFNRMPYYEESLSLNQTPPSPNGTTFKAGMVNPRPLRLAGSFYLPQANVPYTIEILGIKPDGNAKVTAPWPCTQSVLPSSDMQDTIIQKAHAQAQQTDATSRAWIGYFPTNETTFNRGDLNWKYLSSCSQTPGTTVPTNGSCTFSIQEPGQYKMYLFADDTNTSPVIASGVITVSSQNNDALKNGLISYWSMNRDISTNAILSTVIDDLGNNNGTIETNTLTTGKVENAHIFGSNSFSIDHVEIPNSASLAPEKFTIAAWVFPTNANSFGQGNYASIFNRRNTDNQGGMNFELEGDAGFAQGQMHCDVWVKKSDNSIGIARARTATTTKLTPAQWNHAACSYDGATVKIYINGAVVATAGLSGVMNNPTNPRTQIGRNLIHGQNFKGKIDEVGYWSRALTDAEVSTLASGISLYPTTLTPTPTAVAACTPRPNIVRNVTVDNVNKIVNVTATVGTNASKPNNTLKSIKFTRISNATLEVPTNWTLTNPGNETPIYTFPANTTTVSFKEKRIACGAVTVDYTWIDDCGEFKDFSGAGTGATGLTCDTTPTNTFSLSGVMFIDANTNELYEKGETTLINQQISLFHSPNENDPNNAVKLKTIQTNEDGYYKFTDLPQGLYRVIYQTKLEGYTQGKPTLGAFRLDNNFVYDFALRAQNGVTFTGLVFGDVNNNQKFDTNDIPLVNQIVELRLPANEEDYGSVLAMTRTNKNGEYNFPKTLIPNTFYRATLVTPMGYEQSTNNSFAFTAPNGSPDYVHDFGLLRNDRTILGFDITLNGISQAILGYHKREFAVELFDTKNQQVGPAFNTMLYILDGKIGLGHAEVDVSSLPAGEYTIKVKTPQYLRKQIPGIIQIRPAMNLVLPPTTLTVGDVNNDNKIDILDYGIIVSCYGEKAAACQDDKIGSISKKDLSDLNDDRVVDGIDYNLFIRSLSTKTGD